MIQRAVDTYGGLDVLHANAGVERYVDLEVMTEEDMDLLLDVDLKGVLLCAQYSIAPMRARGGGSMIFTSSVQASHSLPGCVVYAAAKAGVVAAARSLTLEVGRDNIRVNAISPGTINTPMLTRDLDDMNVDEAGELHGQGVRRQHARPRRHGGGGRRPGGVSGLGRRGLHQQHQHRDRRGLHRREGVLGFAAAMAEISFRDVTKVYGDGTEAVTSLSLDIADGEFVVLVGPSGCGKSTLLRMLAGLEAITAGEIVVDGAVVNRVHPRDRDVAMVFQNYALYPHMTVFANIAFPLRQAKVGAAEIRRRVTEVAETLELSEQLKRRPAALSGGQRQRVAIGRAIVRQPKAFLLDEPLSNLDAKLRVQMRGELAQLHAELGVTTVFVTHDQTEAMTLGQRVAVLNEGELRQVGTPQELYHCPADLFVAGFIGSPAMNLLKAEVRSGEASAGPVLDFGPAGVMAIPAAAAELCAGAPAGTALVAGIPPRITAAARPGGGLLGGPAPGQGALHRTRRARDLRAPGGRLRRRGPR